MQMNYFVKCPVCGSVTDVKYQYGFSNRHPIRFKCKCGVTILGEFQQNNGVTFKNANLTTEDVLPDYVVYSSGEFLTEKPYVVNNKEDLIRQTTFIHTVQMIEYDEFTKVFSHVVNYRDHTRYIVKMINELFQVGNYELLQKVIRNSYPELEKYIPLKNDVDYLRAVSMINQFQFLYFDKKQTTRRTTDLFVKLFKDKPQSSLKYVKFLNELNRIQDWKQRILNISDNIYEKIDCLIPVIGIDYYKEEKQESLFEDMVISTTSFEDIKQIYVDLYELICSLLIILIGLDNLILRDDFNSIRIDIDPTIKNVKNLTDVSKMRNKGNIIKLIESNAPFQSMLCNSFDSDIRNAIGHFSYETSEVTGSYGQIIRFYNVNNRDQYIDKSLVQICYDIWQMYKSLGIFNELLYRIDIQIQANDKKYLSLCSNMIKIDN